MLLGSKGTVLEFPTRILADSLESDVNVGLLLVHSNRPSTVSYGSNNGRANTHVGIEHDVVCIGQSQDESFDQFYWILSRMDRLFGMIRLDVGNVPEKCFPVFFEESPDVTRILTEPMGRP